MEKKIRWKWLDSLRGLAILLMIIDHLYAHVLGLTEIEGVRLVTRLSMPLFIFVMGFLLVREPKRIRRRGLEVFLAFLAVVPVDLALSRGLNVLLPISIALLAGSFVSPEFFLFGAFLHPFDFSSLVTEYGLFAVFFMAALGYLKRKGRDFEMFAGLALGIFVAFFELYHGLVAYELFALPAVVALFYLFEKKQISLPIIETIGRYPLHFYIAHLYAVLLLSYII